MGEPVPNIMENAIQMAWDFLDRTGELGDPELAAGVLLDAVERMIREGERRPLMLSNKAIDAYKCFKTERHLVLVSQDISDVRPSRKS
ncbi:MAG: hypothetical protein JWL86_3555 [Rhizobium sp.]|nr:hypothetical protein [Rhizobium sp.]